MRLLEHHVDRHAAGGHRLAQRLAQIDLARPRPPPPRGQPGGQRARQRLRPRAASGAAVRRRRAGTRRSRRAAGRRTSARGRGPAARRCAAWSRASTILRSCAMRCAAMALAICSCVGVGLVAVRREQPGQQPALEIVEAHRLERLIRRVRRPTAGVVAAVRLDDLGDHRRQPLVDVGQILVVGRACRAAAARIASMSSGGRPSVVRLVVVEQHGPGAERGREVQIEHRVVGVAVIRRGAAPRRRYPRAAPRGRRGPSTDITRPASTVSDGPTEIPCPRSASTNSTRWPGIPCGASGCGGRVRRTAIS